MDKRSYLQKRLFSRYKTQEKSIYDRSTYTVSEIAAKVTGDMYLHSCGKKKQDNKGGNIDEFKEMGVQKFEDQHDSALYTVQYYLRSLVIIIIQTIRTLFIIDSSRMSRLLKEVCE